MPETTSNPAFMHRCLDLAQRGRGRVGNGALVGAVLVRDGKIIAEGFHATYGGPHAERALLESFTGELLPEDVLYMNLEPCCHQGKTPPCTNLLIERGIKNVIYGMLDPDPRVSGKGIQSLQAAGISVIGPVERALCERVNRGFISVRTKGRPWITIKGARDEEGNICNPDGSSKKITVSEQDTWSHTFLRARHDAILVGVGTILSDNPQLNIRFDQDMKFSQLKGLNGSFKNEKNSFQPYKIVLDPQCRIPLDANVVLQSPEKLILCTSQNAQSQGIDSLKTAGVQVLKLQMSGEHFDWPDLWNAFVTPCDGFSGITSILVEGGERTWQAFRSIGVFDEQVILMGKSICYRDGIHTP